LYGVTCPPSPMDRLLAVPTDGIRANLGPRPLSRRIVREANRRSLFRYYTSCPHSPAPLPERVFFLSSEVRRMPLPDLRPQCRGLRCKFFFPFYFHPLVNRVSLGVLVLPLSVLRSVLPPTTSREGSRLETSESPSGPCESLQFRLLTNRHLCAYERFSWYMGTTLQRSS